MTENTNAAYLYKVASILNSKNSQSLQLLKSYYLMKCKKQSVLLTKQFSSKIRCSRCCTEWKKGTLVKVKSTKLNKKQRRRVKIKKAKKNQKSDDANLLHSNKIEQTCTFCKQTTTTDYTKPRNIKNKCSKEPLTLEVEKANSTTEIKPESRKPPKTNKNKTEINVYSSAKEVFSLKNKKNILASTIKEEPKVIKNNKKKKDKFAGLCQKAVLASAQLKQEKNKQNKLNLFLKPST